jgi:hypothetical protein
MRTIGMRLTSNVKGESTNMCSYCGVYWHRSELRRGRDGKLSCPDEGDLPELADQVHAQMHARIPMMVRSTAEMGRSSGEAATVLETDVDGNTVYDTMGLATPV